MIGAIQKNIIIRALQIRRKNGEDPAEILENYKNLTDQEKEEILKEV